MTNKTKWRINQDTQQQYVDIVQQCLISEEVFNTFRSNGHYCGIISEGMPGNEVEIYSRELKKYPNMLSKFDTIKQMDNIGSPNINLEISTAPRNIRYMYNTARIEEYFGNIDNVVEIGVGFGGMCFTMGNTFSLTGYKLVDIGCVELLAKKFLSKLPSITNGINTETFFNVGPPYDLCISECALSELDDESIQYYYDKYLSKSKHLFIRTNFGDQNRKYQLHDFITMVEKDFVVKTTCDFPTPNTTQEVVLGWKK